jgi:hypothetical protein
VQNLYVKTKNETNKVSYSDSLESKFYINIVHRPEMVPEYLATAKGKTVVKNIIKESLDIFRTQQEIAHDNSLKTTIQMTYASLFNEEVIEMSKFYHEKFGDEIGCTFLGIQCEQFLKKFASKEIAIWLFSMEDKKAIVVELFEKFKDVFGFYPTSTGSYYMDAELVNYIKQKYPMVKCAVATCWEEGPKAYWNANNSWYTLLDGGPWNPWIPSKRNIHCPASNDDDDIGIVAIPHLSRDLMAVFDGPGSYFGTHPQNILRGMVYENREIPYFANIVDQYRSMAKYNNGFSYNMMFVGPGWMGKDGRWEADGKLVRKSYEDGMSYYGQLKRKGELHDVTMSEFADVYRKRKTYMEPECTLWRDILCGSDRQQFWYLDPFMRATLDMNMGGSIIDLRPYVAKLIRPCGVGTKCMQDASYPFVIQSYYRAGYFTHYAGEGSIKSCKFAYNNQEVDLCTCRTWASFSIKNDVRILTLDPVEIEFDGLTIKIQSIFKFKQACGEIEIIRKVLDISNESAEVEANEYLTACYGTTEYPEDLIGVKLICVGKNETKEINYEYKCREAFVDSVSRLEAIVPHVDTRLSIKPDNSECRGYLREGFAFSPMYTLGIKKTLTKNAELRTWLKVERAS